MPANQLRPTYLKDIVGQQAIKENLSIAISAAQRRSRAVPHSLFHGQPGLGKTTFAQVIATEMHSTAHIVAAQQFKTTESIIAALTRLKPNDVLFIDEIHALPPKLQETLYPAMEDGSIDLPSGNRFSFRSNRIPLNPFTLVGATTLFAKLLPPLRDRFRNIYHLSQYSVDELALIVTNAASTLGTKVEPAAAQLIAQHARGVPRLAISYTQLCDDYAQVRAGGRITPAVVTTALKAQGLDPSGLDAQQLSYLKTLAKMGGGPVGLVTLASALNEETSTLETMIEPYLLQRNFIIKTSGGRMITKTACEYLINATSTMPAQPTPAQARLWAA